MGISTELYGFIICAINPYIALLENYFQLCRKFITKEPREQLLFYFDVLCFGHCSDVKKNVNSVVSFKTLQKCYRIIYGPIY